MNMNTTNRESIKKSKVIKNQLGKIQKQEQKILNKKENAFIKSNITPIVDKIQEKIPSKLKSTLDVAFYKGFQLVFEKGNIYIEKTYNKNKIQLNYDLNNYAVDKTMSNKYMNKLDKQSNNSQFINSSIAVLEGGILGVLGIGLPDIPLFISVIIKTINEIALSYGFDYNKEEEKAFILSLICGAITSGEKQHEFDKQVDKLAEHFAQEIQMNIDLKEEMKATANVLSDALLTAKFIQGIPFVGVVGGIVNHTIIKKISNYAKIKYKKRYLLSKIEE